MDGKCFAGVVDLLNHSLDTGDVLLGFGLSGKAQEAFQSSSLILYATDIGIGTYKLGILTQTIGSFSVHLFKVKGKR